MSFHHHAMPENNRAIYIFIKVLEIESIARNLYWSHYSLLNRKLIKVIVFFKHERIEKIWNPGSLKKKKKRKQLPGDQIWTTKIDKK